MPPLYVVKQGAKLRIKNRRLTVEYEEEPLISLPIAHVSQVVLCGNIGLTTPAIGALLKRNIEVVFLSADGKYRGRLISSITPHVPLRRAQYRALDDPEFPLSLAKGFVTAKLQHQRALLIRHNRERNEDEIHICTEQIKTALTKIPRKVNLNSLSGLEGSASATYFRGLKHLFDSQWGFKKRNRRPPKDPVNVLLSLGYTLLAQTAFGAVSTVGLDPYAGFLHQIVYNRPALALDLMEEFRPVVDGIVLWCLNGKIITQDDFAPGDEKLPVLLQDEGKRRFLKAFEDRFDNRFTHPIRGERLTMRQCILEQARQVTRCIREKQPIYRGMGFR